MVCACGISRLFNGGCDSTHYYPKLAREDGRRYRELVGEMNDFFLDSVRGMKEIQLFGYAKQRLDEIQQRSQKSIPLLSALKTKKQKKLRVYTEVAVSVF